MKSGEIFFLFAQFSCMFAVRAWLRVCVRFCVSVCVCVCIPIFCSRIDIIKLFSIFFFFGEKHTKIDVTKFTRILNTKKNNNLIIDCLVVVVDDDDDYEWKQKTKWKMVLAKIRKEKKISCSNFGHVMMKREKKNPIGKFFFHKKKISLPTCTSMLLSDQKSNFIFHFHYEHYLIVVETTTTTTTIKSQQILCIFSLCFVVVIGPSWISVLIKKNAHKHTRSLFIKKKYLNYHLVCMSVCLWVVCLNFFFVFHCFFFHCQNRFAFCN